MRLPQIGDSCRRRSDQKLYIISADTLEFVEKKEVILIRIS
jgi:hypothetical protein